MMSDVSALRRMSCSKLWLAGLAALGLVLLGSGACSPELEVKGNTQRVIGERVTLALVEGDVFGTELTLTDADKVEAQASALDIQQADERTLSFVIPPGTAAGAATVRVKQKGGGTYVVPLTISRLAVAVGKDGRVETLALPPSTLGATTPSTAIDPFVGQQVVMTLDGGTAVALAGTGFYTFRLGKDPQTGPSLAITGTCIAALPQDGVVVGTATSIQAYRRKESVYVGNSLTGPSNVRAIAAADDGTRAIALATCGSNNCLLIVDVSGVAPKKESEVLLGPSSGATLLAIRADGKGAVVVDGSTIYGVDLAGTPKITTLSIGKGVAIARATTVINNQANDLFAIADETSLKIRLVGFQGNVGSQVLTDIDSNIDLGGNVPSHLAFGRGAELYVVTGTKLLKIDASAKDAVPVPLSQQLTQAPLSFVVQP